MRADEKGKKEKLYFDGYNPSDLDHVIETQHKIIKMRKAAKRTKLCSVLVVIDDFADDPIFTRQSKLLHACFYTRQTQQYFNDHKHTEFREYPPNRESQRRGFDSVPLEK